MTRFEIEQRIRIEVSRLEHLTARANLDVARYGGWRSDYDGWRQETEAALENLFEKLNAKLVLEVMLDAPHEEGGDT